MVPMLTCGLVRSNFAFATVGSSCWDSSLPVMALLGVWAGRPGASLLAPDLLDDLLRDVPGNLRVGLELHRIARPALGLAAEVPDVAEHLRQWNQRLDDAGAGTLLHGLDVAAAGVQVADDVAHVVLRRDHLDGEHRLEEHGVGSAGRLLERHRTGDLERELGGVHLVVGPVAERHLDVDQRVTGDDTELHRLLDALVDGGDVLARDASTGDGVDELVAAVTLTAGRLDVDDDLGELARPTGLLLVGVGDLLDLAADGLAISHLGLADVGLDAELALHPFDEHLEVQFAHAGDDGLAGVVVGADLEGRVLLGQPLDRRAELLLVALGPRLDRHRDDRGREAHRLQDDRPRGVGQSVTSGGVLQPHDRDDLPGARPYDLFTLVRVHPVDLADPLLVALGAVQHLGAGRERAGVDANERELAEVLVAHDLERQRRDGCVLVGLAGHDAVLVADRVALDRTDVERRRQVAHDGVEHGLHALVLERGAAEHRGELAGDGSPADRRDERPLGGLLALEVQLHHLVVVLGDGLEQPVTVLGGGLGVAGRDVDGVVHLALLRLRAPDHGLHADQVYDTAEVRLGPDRKLNDQRHGLESRHDHVDAAVELGADPVQLVDEADARDAVLGGLSPHLLGLWLNPRDAVEHRDRAVQHSQRPLDLDGEVDVAGRVDDVDRMAVPLTGGRGGRDGDAALLLLLHPVHGGRSLMDLTDLVVDAGVVQDPLGGRGLACVDVGHDPDVADLGQIGGHLGDHSGASLPLDVSAAGVTSGSGRRPCWTRPSCGCPRVA